MLPKAIGEFNETDVKNGMVEREVTAKGFE